MKKPAEERKQMDSSSSPKAAKDATTTTNSTKDTKKKNHLSSVTESNLLTRTTIYSSLAAIDQGTLVTSGLVKSVNRQRLVAWCQDVSEQLHRCRLRLDGKNNGARPNRPDETATNLTTRGLLIGKKDFLTSSVNNKSKSNKSNKRKNTASDNLDNDDPCTLRHKRRKRIYNRLLSRQEEERAASLLVTADDGSATATGAAAATTTTSPMASAKNNQAAATLQYVQKLSQCWQRYYRQMVAADETTTANDEDTTKQEGRATTAIAAVGSALSITNQMCWIGAPVVYQDKQEAVICGETRTAWCLFRLLDKSKSKIVYVTKRRPLLVSMLQQQEEIGSPRIRFYIQENY
jgi:hypothetical protein